MRLQKLRVSRQAMNMVAAAGSVPGGPGFLSLHSPVQWAANKASGVVPPATWALRVAFCESSAQPSDVSSVEVSSALALGWFQHLAKFWTDRSAAAGSNSLSALVSAV